MALAFLDNLRAFDPLKEIETFSGKLLLFQGDADPAISIEESARYIELARRKGLETASHVLQGADHNFSTVASVDFLCSTIGEWIKERWR
jgi:dipeptidyl aminopeptidase/acylaminoacyl peptidase